MPAAIPAIIAAATTAATGATFLGLTGAYAALAAGVSTFALGTIANALGPKASSPDLSSYLSSGGTTKQVREPVSSRATLYGEARVSGTIAYIGSSNDNLYLHQVIILASHEVEEIGEVWLTDESVPEDYLDASGMVTKGRYANKLRIKKHLGAPGQLADTDLALEVTDWSLEHRLEGIAYIYVRMQYDRDVYPSSVPNVSAWVKGKKLYDPRSDTTGWSNNTALIARDYLTDLGIGFNVPDTVIDSTELTASLNNCDEMVTTSNIATEVTEVDGNIFTLDSDYLEYQTGDKIEISSTGSVPTGIVDEDENYCIVVQRTDTVRIELASSYANALDGTAQTLSSEGTGIITVTKVAEPRYVGGGVIKSDASPYDVISNIASAMGGNVIKSGSKYSIVSGYYRSPDYEFTEADLAGPIKLKTKTATNDRFNTIIGTYISPLNKGQPSDYPQVTNSTMVSNDGRTITRKLDQPFVQRPHLAQRLAKIEIEKAYQEQVFSAPFKMGAFKVQAGDVIQMTIANYGWSQKLFEVIEWSLAMQDQQGTVVPVINMVLRETASTVYDWNNGEETAVDPAPNTSLPNHFDVFAPSGLVVTPVEILTESGDKTYKFRIGWNSPANAFVTSGGKYEIQFKKSSDSEWKRSFQAEDDDTSIEVNQVEKGVNYDFRMRAVNSFGVRSTYSALTGFTVESGGGASSQLDYGTFTNTHTVALDYGTFTNTHTSTEDYGEFV